MKRAFALLAVVASLAATPAPKPPLPKDFVYLSDVAPDVMQDIRYAGFHNFVGRPVAGYLASECILTRQAAQALAAVESELVDAGLTLRVYDCYRPQQAVDEFVKWSKDSADQKMKREYFPNVNKADLFKLGYLAAKSEHSRGSAVDASVERLPPRPIAPYGPNEPLHPCTGLFAERFHDGTIDMGTTFDCLDPLSHPDADVGTIAGAHRQLLNNVMKKHGFKRAETEWWHFTLRWEPFPSTYFNFPIPKR